MKHSSPFFMPHIRAPELPKNLTWLNTDRAISLAELRGRIVLLDFWTYGCINCLHVLPDLKYLEQKYADSLTVIGVHCGKFDREKDPDNIQSAVLRYNIEHPVLVDSEFKAWDQYAVRAYPTFVLIDRDGYIVSTVSGEGKRSFLDDLLERLQDGVTVPRLDLTIAPPPSTPLKFPGKVLADEKSDRLFISDTGHDRIIISTLNGEILDLIEPFSDPQGLALVDQMLYIADTGNHQIRAVDLETKQVRAIAGTGKQSQIIYPHCGKALETDLNSPWDLAIVENQLFIAMAGSHQIWKLEDDHIMTFAGTGAEGCFDGSLEEAAFAQPSGLATDGKTLFVADSETSSIREVTQSSVQTICGSGDLYGFGDIDGIGDQVQLQHCLGVACEHSTLWIADSYNHKIKRLENGKCQTIADGFSEPSGISVTSKAIYVANTNHHEIRVIDRETLRVSAIAFPKLCAPDVCLP